jgi:transcription initiation factor IIE alpha subunit
MFGLFKSDPRKKLEAAYRSKLEEAMHCQRNGDILNYSRLSAEAAELEKQLDALDKQA